MILIDELMSTVRKLAKTSHWQTIYSQAKEISGLHLFNNVNSFTYLQIIFLNKLSFYNSIYLDIALDEVSEIVLDNEIYEDAYSYYRSRIKRDKKIFNTENLPSRGIQTTDISKSSWVFRRKKK